MGTADHIVDLSVFRATSNTVIVRITTPVGRERFYGADRSDLRAALPTLAAAPYWKRLPDRVSD